MRLRKSLLLFIVLFCSVLSLKAQDDTPLLDTVPKPKKPLMLSFGLDLNLKTLSATYNHDYTGEYNIYGNGPTGWEWVTHNNKFNNLRNYGPFTDLKLSVSIANSKVFQLGLSYNFGAAYIPLTTYDANGNLVVGASASNIFAGISLLTEYNYYFNRKTYTEPYLYGGVDIGSYTGTDQVFGPGTPIYLQGRLGFGFDFKHDVMLKVFISSDHLIYWESETSQVFQRTESIKINLDALYIGFGISKTFTLFPD